MRFAGSANTAFTNDFQGFEHRESASRDAYKPNAFQWISALFGQKGTEMINKRQVL